MQLQIRVSSKRWEGLAPVPKAKSDFTGVFEATNLFPKDAYPSSAATAVMLNRGVEAENGDSH
jgi:hypothetical protein